MLGQKVEEFESYFYIGILGVLQLIFVKQVQATVQHIRNIFDQYLTVHDKLESSLRELSRNGDVQSCKAARKAADSQFKELTKELKPLLSFLHSCSQASSIWPKVCYC